MSVLTLNSDSPSVLKNRGSEFTNVSVGDSVRIGVLMIEGNKERTQFFEGTVLSIKKREGRKTLRVRKVSQCIGIEKLFLLDSPKVVSLERKKISKVRRAKLYFLRGLGKTKKLKNLSWKLNLLRFHNVQVDSVLIES